MKATIITCLLLAAVFAATQPQMSINVGSAYKSGTQDVYPLSCSGATGAVTFTVSGLPQGAKIVNNQLVVTAESKSGNYVLTIRAVDQAGNVAENIVNLSVNSILGGNSFTNNNGGNTNTNGGNTNTNGGNTNTNTNGGNNPNGGNNNPNGGNTSPNGGNTVTDVNRLNTLINTYSSVTEIQQTITYTNNRYPSGNFPTGADTTATNTDLITINTQQTTPSTSNRNTITYDDVALRTASERHQNAIKAITNLLTIIDQARANKNQAFLDISKYNAALNDAKAKQRDSQTLIVSIQVRIQQISSAIQGIDGKNGDTQKQIDDLTAERARLVARNEELTRLIQEQINQRNGLQTRLDAINAQLSGLRATLTVQETKCASIQQQITTTEAELKKLQDQAATLKADIATATADLNAKQAIVDDLEKRLAAAKLERDAARARLENLRQLEVTIGPQIAALIAKLQDLRSQYTACQNEVTRLHAQIKDLEAQAAELQKNINGINAVISGYETERNKNTARIAEIDALLKLLRDAINSSQSDSGYLKSQLTIANEELRKAYLAGNDANTLVYQAQQNLNAATARYNTETQNVNTATLNLEKARSEEALARLALEETIAKYSDALPYAIVPNGNGNTPAGTPYGNNPSGSPLGPINTNGSGAAGSFTVNDWTHYLSSAFGAGVNPAFTGSVTTLYPFNFLSTVNGNTVNNNYNNLRTTTTTTTTSTNTNSNSYNGVCGGNGVVTSTSGVITQVGPNSFNLALDNGQNVVVNVAPCTQTNSNVANYQMSTGDVAVVKGVQKSSSVIDGQNVVCLA